MGPRNLIGEAPVIGWYPLETPSQGRGGVEVSPTAWCHLIWVRGDEARGLWMDGG